MARRKDNQTPIYLPLAGPDPQTPDWFAMRVYDADRDPPVIFGASEAAAVCGLSPYESPLHVYLRKRQLSDARPDTDAMRLGRKLEPIVIDEYRERTGFEVMAPRPMFFHPTMRFLAATPDGDVAADGKHFPLDAKTTSAHRVKEFGEEGTDELPDDYVLQAQQQMLVMGAALQDTAVLVDGRTLRIYRVVRNDDLCQAIVDAARELAERIANDDPPEPHWTHPRTPELLKSLYGIDEERKIALSEETALLWRTYQRLGEEIKERETERKQVQARVLGIMQDAAVGRYEADGFELVRKKVTRKAYECKECEYVTLTERKIKV